jgi:malonyl-CoA O-methyltransferase
MLLNFIDKKIRQSFSDAALEYDVLTSLHKEIGRELMRKVIDNENTSAILDVGMGTGWLTSKLKFYLPESRLVGIDFAPGMVKIAKDKYQELDIIQANASKLPFEKETFDIIVSNLAYQWVNDLGTAFGECFRCLKSDGKIYLTLFGYHTFQEMLEAFSSTQKDSPQPFRRLSNKEEVAESILKAGFRDVVADYELIKVRFPDLVGLMKWIKDIGANSVRNHEVFIGKEWVNRASDYYDAHHKDRLGLYATFEVIWVQARK